MPAAELTTAEVYAAGRNILKAPSPKRTAAAIRERMAAIDAVMGLLTGTQHYGNDFYVKLGAEWSRLAGMLDDAPAPAGGRLVATAAAGWQTRSGSGSSSFEAYAAAEEAWQRDPRRADVARSTGRPIPASWRLPARAPTRRAPAPSVRLDADTPPRVTVLLARSALEAIEAECIRSDDMETGGWLVGRIAFGWHRERAITDATVAARTRAPHSVRLRRGRVPRPGREPTRGRHRGSRGGSARYRRLA